MCLCVHIYICIYLLPSSLCKSLAGGFRVYQRGMSVVKNLFAILSRIVSTMMNACLEYFSLTFIFSVSSRLGFHKRMNI